MGKINSVIFAVLILLCLTISYQITLQTTQQAIQEQSNAEWLLQAHETKWICLYIHGKRYFIPDAVCFRRLFIDNTQTDIDQDIFESIPYGGDISPNAQLARAKDNPDAKTYLLTGAEKWQIQGGEHFNNYGFDWGKIVYCEPSYLDLFITGMIIQFNMKQDYMSINLVHGDRQILKFLKMLLKFIVHFKNKDKQSFKSNNQVIFQCKNYFESIFMRNLFQISELAFFKNLFSFTQSEFVLLYQQHMHQLICE